MTRELVVEADGRLIRIAVETLLDNAWKLTQRRDFARIEIGVDHRRIGVQQEWCGVFEISNRCVKTSNDRIVIQSCHSDGLRHCQTRAAIPIAQSGR